MIAPGTEVPSEAKGGWNARKAEKGPEGLRTDANTQ